MDRVDPQDLGLPVDDRVELADQLVVVQDGKREVPPTTLVLRLVHLQVVLEVEQLLGSDAVVDQAIERRQQCRAPLERLTDGRRVDHPAARGSLDLGGLSGDLFVVPFPRDTDHLGPGDAECAQSSRCHDAAGLVQRDDLGDGGVDALGEIPEPLPSATPSRRNLATRG